ncbi:MAG: amidohydrolase/deacetylase family metallohydrolase [Saprospiraceae bacterium]|nr:amidohydrolase/deacetylase family metallohydrolase [Saprospiraceae bacterium]MCB9319714.1 amidohydrolase/deacetylase family metallohydrolase [Lewinellaceae bacterium]
MNKKLFVLLGSLLWSVFLVAQPIDILIKGGRVIDPKNHLDGIMDVGIKDGKINRVAANIPASEAFRVVDATGKLVVPGLIDIHGHHFFGTEENRYLRNSFTALPPDGFTFRAGVTTVVDAGSPGWRNFDTYKAQTIDHSQTRVLTFLNIVGSGMAGGPIEQDLLDMDPRLTAMEAKANSKYIVGIKLAHFSGHNWEPAMKAAQAGRDAGIPVMIDFGGATPTLPLDSLLLDVLRPGDIMTHCFAHVSGRDAIVDDHRKVRDCVWAAQKKGIIFDVGHGGGSFLWDQAVPAFEQGFHPNTISTDLHTGSMNGGMKDMTNVMSKMLILGMSLPDVIEASTWKPAQVIQRPELGNLDVGAEADIAIISVEKGNFGYVDTKGWKYPGKEKLVAEVTFRAGKIVWDLNGMTSPTWEK